MTDHSADKAPDRTVAGVDGDAQLGFPAFRHLTDATLQVRCGPQQVPTFLEELTSGLCEHRTMTAPVEKQHVQILLHLLN
jgi:hypothetical protein